MSEALHVHVARLVPAAIVPVLALALALSGGFYPSSWLPASLGLAAAFCIAALGGPAARLGRLQTVGIGAIVLLAAWSYLSIVWSGLPGSSLTEANRAAAYALAIALVVRVGSSPEHRRDLLVLTAGASGVLAVVIGARLAFGDAAALFADGRLTWPIGYPNAVAAFLMVGLWPLVTLGSNPLQPLLVRSIALAGALAIPATALLTVSRAGALFAGVGIVVYFAVSPLRLRSLIPAGLAFGPCAAAWTLLERPQHQGADLTSAAAQAPGRLILGLAVAGAIVGAAWSLVDARVRVPARATRTIGGVVLLVVLASLVGGLVVASRHDASGFVHRRVHAFKAGQNSDRGGNRLLTSGSNRYDFWRVAMIELRARPSTGYGAGAWSWRYLQERRSSEEPANAHGTFWEVAGDLGVPGLVLYCTFVVAAFAACAARGRGEQWPESASLIAALAVGLGHSQVDWLWETFPTGLLIACLIGLALAGARPSPRPSHRLAGRLAVVVVAVVALVAVLPALLAERYTDDAYRASPQDARTLAKRGALLDPLAAAPELALADAEQRLGDGPARLTAARAAASREPRDWAAWLAVDAAARAVRDDATASHACLEAQLLKPGVACSG